MQKNQQLECSGCFGILLLLLLLPLSLLSQEASVYSALSSQHASYDGNALVLKGDVHLDHLFGQMSAEEAILKKQEIGKDFPFSEIHLQKQVALLLKNNAELTCECATLDFSTLKGVLSSSLKGMVVYRDMIENKNLSKALFQLKSPLLELEIANLNAAHEKPLYEIDTILAKESVQIDYANRFTLLADHALLQGGKRGAVTAYPKDADSLCLLTHDEDRIDCSLVELSLVDCKAKLHAPKGRLISSLTPNLPKGDLRFHSKFLIWDAQNNTLTLKEDVELDESTFGNLKTDQEILLTQKEQNGKRIISSIKTTGKTHLEYKTPKGLNQRLTCFGNIVIDRQQHHAHAESPVVKGKVDEKEQIIFENDDTLIYADKAFLEYALTDDVLEPASLDLKGNVRLTTRDANQSLRCACADRLNYSPNTQTLTLSANRGKKVLFWNEEQLLRISAQEVHITRDPLTKKESVKGIGNVRFAFTLEEHHLLNKVFPKFMIGP